MLRTYILMQYILDIWYCHRDMLLIFWQWFVMLKDVGSRPWWIVATTRTHGPCTSHGFQLHGGWLGSGVSRPLPSPDWWIERIEQKHTCKSVMPCEDSHRLRSFRVDLHSQPVAMICCSLVFLDTCVYCNASSIFLLSKSRQSLRFTALPRWHEHPAVTCLGTLNPIGVNNISSHNICKRRVSMCFECVFDGMVFLCYTLSANESSEPPMMIPGSTRSRSIVTTPGKINMEPENKPSQKESNLPTTSFQVLC